MDKQQEEVLQFIEQNGVNFIRLWFTDVSGQLKAVAIDPAELEDAFQEGIGFDGSAIEGMTRVYESDMLLKPDASTFQILPWRSGEHQVGRMFCDVYTPDNQPARCDPRTVLERQLDRAAKLGFTFQIHPEIEFYLMHPPTSLDVPLRPIDQASYFDHVPNGGANDFRRRAVRMLEEVGISVEFSHHENGPGQNEIDLRAVDALTAADNIMTFRVLIQEIALQEGMIATFMPKPLADAPGNGMHSHMSLFEGEENAFFDPTQEYQLSRTGQHFMAGILAHARETAAICNQHVNSYKRLWGGGEAPSFICWAHNNRSALIRVPHYKPNKAQAARIEYRALDTATNPYLAYAVLLAAGLDGIERELPLPEEAEDNMWRLNDQERHALGIQPLPYTLEEAVAEMRESEFMAEVLGEEVFAYVLRNKEHEWRSYSAQITPLELARFLKF